MARKVFFSFHFEVDNWRTGQVRNIGAIEGNKPVRDNDWEEVKRRGDYAIQNWIDNQLKGTSCIVVLVGSQTASRKWVKYEIQKGWELGKGVAGIYIHNLLDQFQKPSYPGNNPFLQIYVDSKKGRINLGNLITIHNPPYNESKYVYWNIESNIESWVEEAIKLREWY